MTYTTYPAYQCNECEFSSNSFLSFADHRGLHADPSKANELTKHKGMDRSPHVGYGTKKLIIRNAITNPKRYYVCYECDYYSRSKQLIKKHVVREHGVIIPEVAEEELIS